MAELWDIYDGNKKKTGRTAERGVYEFKDGEYHLVVQAIILNTKNEDVNPFLKKISVSAKKNKKPCFFSGPLV